MDCKRPSDVTSILGAILLLAPSASLAGQALDCDSNGLSDAIEIETGFSPDCNGNGRPDACDLEPNVLVPERIVSYDLPDECRTFLVADFDGDGDTDVAASSSHMGILLLWNEGNGALGRPLFFSDGDSEFIHRTMYVQDIDQDGDQDLLTTDNFVAAEGSSEVRLLRNKGDRSFGEVERLPATTHAVAALAMGDFDGDSDVDIAALDYQGNAAEIAILANEGGQFAAPRRRRLGIELNDLIASDRDRDGDLDLVAASRGSVHVLTNQGGGEFSDPVRTVVPFNPFGLTSADLNGSGFPDLVVGSFGSDLLVLLDRPDGSLDLPGARYQLQQGRVWKSITAADVDGDGDIDVSGGASSLLYNKGRGTFYPEIPLGTSERAGFQAVADLDSGLPELLGVTGYPYQLTVFSTALVPRGLDCNLNELPDDCDLASGTSSDCNSNHLPDDCELDCNENGVPDDCDLALGLRTDLNFNGVPDDCDIPLHFFPDCDGNGIVDSEEDCNVNFVPDGCEMASGALEDCSGNGVPDVCEPDCNGNDRPDDCDIQSGSSADANSDGIPDDCEEPARFILGFRAPAWIPGEPGTEVGFHAFARLTSQVLTPEEPGVQGWSIGILCDGGEIYDVTIAGTDAGDAYQNGFRSFDWVNSALLPPNSSAVVGFMILSATEPVGLDVRKSPHDILKLTVASRVPADGGCGTCRLSFQDGLAARGQPVMNAVTYSGKTCYVQGCEVGGSGPDFSVELDAKVIQLCPPRGCAGDAAKLCSMPDFRRGDVNSDGRVDISDAIRTFMFLFLGSSAPRCLDAADASDDEQVDLSDGLRILNDFFRQGTGIPYPGAFFCGPDITGGALGCAEYRGCN